MNDLRSLGLRYLTSLRKRGGGSKQTVVMRCYRLSLLLDK